MKKIAFILGGMTRGGAERVISILSNYYADKGFETDLLLLLTNEVGYNLHPSTNIIDFTGKGKSRIKKLPFWRKSIRKYVKENKPDVIVSFFAKINVIVLSSVGKTRTKIIVSERNDPRLDGRSKIIDFLTKRYYKRADKVVFQTERAKSYFSKLKNGVIIPNPIKQMENDSERNPNKIVTVGKLMKQKNQKMLISAFSKVVQKFPNAFLEIYGEGELREELTAQISELGLTEKVFLMGNKENVHDYIKDAGIFCMSSNYEGLSNALLEAMMLSLPCISTDCAGAGEYITNGENGFVVPVGDENSMSEKIEQLLSDQKLREEFSKKAKEQSFRFELSSVMKQWDNLIEE